MTSPTITRKPLPGALLPDIEPTAPARPNGNRWYVALVAVTLLAGAVLRLQFFRMPLSVDEGGDAYIALHWFSTHGSIYGRYWLDRPPLLLLEYRAALSGGVDGIRMLGLLASALLALATAVAARRFGGRTAAVVAVVVSTLLTSTTAFDAIFTDAELLAAVPAAWCIALLLGGRERTDGLGPSNLQVACAGALAGCAMLTKQSSFDAIVAGSAIVLTLPRRSQILAVFLAGVGGPLSLAAAWAATTSVGLRGVIYALYGFRIDGLRALDQSSIPLSQRLDQLQGPPVQSGAMLLVPFAFAGCLVAWRRGTFGAIALPVWAVAAAFGVLGGGYYWSHYYIQLVAPVTVSSSIALALALRSGRAWLAVAASTLALFATIALHSDVEQASAAMHHESVVSQARFLRANKRPGDTLYVQYARANLGFYSGMEQPYPYEWSLMLRVLPDAQRRIAEMLAGRGRPVWVVQWQERHTFGMDRDGRIRRQLELHYRPVSVVCHRTIWLTRARAVGRLAHPPQDCRGAG